MPPPSVLLLACSAMASFSNRYPACLYSSSAAGCNSDVLNSSCRIVKPAAFSFRKLQHRPGDPAASGGGVDIHATQLHGVRRCGFKAEHADELLLPQRDPKAAASLTIVSGDAIHFLGQ